MRIIVDAMGGDNAPSEIIKGALRAKRELGVELVLVGREKEIAACLGAEDLNGLKTGGQNLNGPDNGSGNQNGPDSGAGNLNAPDAVALPGGIEIVNAEEIITMDDDPSTATRRKKDSSMAVALRLLAEGRGDAVVSAGSTGALLTGATLTVKRIKGIRRAALAPVLPVGRNGVMLIDCGANVECTAEYLLQFAFMGSFYAGKIMGCRNPRVGLLNVGTEDTKGGALQHQAFELLKKADKEGKINFVGNIEGTTVFSGDVDVVVTDGFTGNILLKTTEGVIKFLMNSLKGVFYKSLVNKLAAAVIKKDLKAMKKSMDVNEVGGTALIGISKPVIKAHGSSNADAFFAAIRQAVAFSDSGTIELIKENIDCMMLHAEGE